jgi:cytochrome c biogenesis factor
VIVLGEMSLRVALLMAVWAVIVSVLGGATRRPELVASGERGLHAALVLVAVASAGLWTGLVTRDFSIGYVASHTSANLPAMYTISAFWAGRGGSFLLWTLVLAGWSAVALYTSRKCNRELMPYVTASLAVVMLTFLGSLLLVESPFDRLSWTPPEGRGMSPQLQRPGMAVYLPVLYLGYAATTVLFALSTAALVIRRMMAELLAHARRWTLVAWVFTTAGLFTGMRSAYVDADWRGHWLLQPLDSASLLPWLVTTALLLSLAAQERRGVVRKWNVILMLSAFLLAILATLSPGSGSITGVRPLAQSPGGLWTVTLFAAAIVICGVLVVDRLPDLEIASTSESESGAGQTIRRYGRYAAAFGMVVLFVGFAGQLFRKEYGVRLRVGEATELTDPYGGEWRFVSDGVSRYLILNRRVTAATISVYRDGTAAGLLTSEWRQHVDSRGVATYDPSTEPGLISTVRQDVYTVLADLTQEDTVGLRISFNPLAWLVWLGGAAVTLGAVIALWPSRQATRAATLDTGSGE